MKRGGARHFSSSKKELVLLGVKRDTREGASVELSVAQQHVATTCDNPKLNLALRACLEIDEMAVVVVVRGGTGPERVCERGRAVSKLNMMGASNHPTHIHRRA